MMTPIAFFASNDVVLIPTPDVDGFIERREGFQAYVYAESEHGDRVRLHVGAPAFYQDKVMPAADRLAAALTARLAAGKLPVAFDRWETSRPAYGSDAYIQYGQQDDLALERREEEEFA